ncbi:hypothetical protein CALVIDRAFT_568972 [Calocera viscosa TUFC12733]|uniref:Uncharacterized protein n=1 Tax=Calocera viscosa (strain TUFC12733) TaxID=1330018 RepID=A0A167GH17_CALVF|nr:hypothetical protein CALVIDRAFT_568972 [Calocera viscosa TUFC12733]
MGDAYLSLLDNLDSAASSLSSRSSPASLADLLPRSPSCPSSATPPLSLIHHQPRSLHLPPGSQEQPQLYHPPHLVHLPFALPVTRLTSPALPLPRLTQLPAPRAEPGRVPRLSLLAGNDTRRC